MRKYAFAMVLLAAAATAARAEVIERIVAVVNDDVILQSELNLRVVAAEDELDTIADPQKQAEIEEAKALNVRVVKRALAMEGTCTGEHGIGIGKQAYLAEELGEAVDLMRDLKKVFDPDNLMNPGKVVPAPS